jgi:ABC-type Fe3+/spermidine/putrescine transport system ATPase subunit
MNARIELASVRVRIDSRSLLEAVDLAIAPGEILALLGPSGSGKTTLLRAVLGFVTPESGAVRLDGETASIDGRIRIPPEARRLGVVFQDLALWPHLSVYGNLAFVLGARSIPRHERRARVAAMLERVGLPGFERRRPADLSGGEQQRVAIARSLIAEPRAVLLDEPLANLDVVRKREMLAFFRELLVAQRSTALYVTHDPREAALLADRVAVLEAGRIVQIGALDAVRADPATPFVRALLCEELSVLANPRPRAALETP